MTQDPISDMLTQIRNALAVKKPEVVLPYSKFKHSLSNLLAQNGWLEKAEVLEEEGVKTLKLHLKYDETGMPVISCLVRMSKPGQRIYAKNAKIPKVRMGHGLTIVSTSKGLMTDREAQAEKVGGEVICQIW